MKNIIKELGLSKHPEVGFFRQSFKSAVKVQPQDQTDRRAAFTHIYYYLPKGAYSRFHKIDIIHIIVLLLLSAKYPQKVLEL